jgi:hypothetical protein
MAVELLLADPLPVPLPVAVPLAEQPASALRNAAVIAAARGFFCNIGSPFAKTCVSTTLRNYTEFVENKLAESGPILDASDCVNE